MAGETGQDFAGRLRDLKGRIVAQGGRVQEAVDRSFEALFEGDADKARSVVAGDGPIDDADLEIERKAVELLADAAREANELPIESLRAVLVIVKANNELERIADCAAEIGELVPALVSSNLSIPPTFRVMTNSVVGIVRDAMGALEHDDPKLAKLVLKSESCVRDFKRAILREADLRIKDGNLSVEHAFDLHEIATQCEHMADHSSNVAEQVIYATTGTIVRHAEGKWVEISNP